jgi:hypothetical protein
VTSGPREAGVSESPTSRSGCAAKVGSCEQTPHARSHGGRSISSGSRSVFRRLKPDRTSAV